MNDEHANIDSKIIDFEIIATNNIRCPLSSFTDKNILLFFYPRDNTPICTQEAKAFRDHIQAFLALNTIIFGVSLDNLASHEKFKEKLQLPFELISDSQEELCNYFGVIKIKNFFGKKVRGVVRSTFLIDRNLVLRYEWRKIKVAAHISEVLTAAAEIK